MNQINPIAITKEGDRWLARFRWSHETKEAVKQAGWFFSPTEKLWYTRDPVVAARLDPNAMQAAQAHVAKINASIKASRATNASIEVPAPEGLSYLPYQLAGISYLRNHQDALLGDEMGLGKTIQTIGLINSDPSIRHVLIVCPATIKINWARELHKWLVETKTIGIADGGHFPDTDIVIINFDILHRHRAIVDRISWDLLAVDECHFVKNSEARRTQALFGKTSRNPAERIPPIKARRQVYMTGTPIVNRPKELWTLVRAIDPEGLGKSFFKFHMRYTDAQHNGYGWNFDGASNLEELQTKLRSTCMIRRLKVDVLPELPPKRRQIVVLPTNGASATVQQEWATFKRHKQMIDRAEQAAKKAKTLGDHEAYSAAMRELHKGLKIGFEEMAALRHATAVAKIPHVIEHVRGCLENVDKLVVFVHHHDVANALLEAFPNAALVTGEIKPGSRTAQVDQFQHDPNCRVFIGSIQAAGVGLTLTAAQLAIFAELDWVPGNINQAEDRLHRIGQLGSVLIQHLVFVDSVDSYMANMIIDKLETIEAALDTRTKPIEGPTEEQILEASARLREIEAQKTSPYLDASLTQRGRGQVLDEVETEVPF